MPPPPHIGRPTSRESTERDSSGKLNGSKFHELYENSLQVMHVLSFPQSENVFVRRSDGTELSDGLDKAQ